MKLKDYGRNHKKHKEYIKQSGLLLVGVDVSKAKHNACTGTLEGVRCRIGFRNARDGFKRFEDAIRGHAKGMRGGHNVRAERTQNWASAFPLPFS